MNNRAADATKMTTRCPVCRYDLTGLPGEHRCPECGFEYDPETRIWRMAVADRAKFVLVSLLILIPSMWILLSFALGWLATIWKPLQGYLFEKTVVGVLSVFLSVFVLMAVIRRTLVIVSTEVLTVGGRLRRLRRYRLAELDLVSTDPLQVRVRPRNSRQRSGRSVPLQWSWMSVAQDSDFRREFLARWRKCHADQDSAQPPSAETCPP